MEEPKESFPSQKRRATELQDLFDLIHAEQLLIEPAEKCQEEKDQKVNKPSSFYGHGVQRASWHLQKEMVSWIR